ncbi:carbohydrate ABC transporter substrate-binding protein [Geobacillus sp. BMUD]|uniref:ABC transporter substrate-binding protein n=1 Tax=Geobacillus sp. BMUD TaxID=2508876 RepID=UPI001490A613|nr:ABC transporter substrate-binding protein [Geobacillus sp. BMUD]NNU83396.1 carbohydrate ABC transporter substrate-binding protein [Geobacillus sp. BMUD]
MFNKKKICAFLSLSLFSLSILSACSQEGDQSNAKNGNGKDVTIQYWHANVEEERVQLLKELIQKFEKQNPGIHVQQVPVPEEDLPNKISAAMGANQLPAIIESGIEQTLLLSEEGVSDTKLHEEIINEIGKDDFFRGVLDTTKSPDGNGYLGVPIYGWVQGIWYNKRLFEEKGLEAPTTWENILKAAKTFYDPANKKYGIVIGTQKDQFTEQTFSQFALSNNAAIFDEKGKINVDSPEMKESLNFYKELAKYTPEGAESWREAKEMYLSERAPMVMYSTYIMGDLSQNTQLAQSTGFAIPEKKKKASFGQITSFVITNTISEDERNAAKRFTKFLMEKENYIKFLHMSPGGQNPTRKSIAQDPEYLNNEVLKTFGEVASQIPFGLENLQRFDVVNGKIYPEMSDISAQFIISEGIYNMTEHGIQPDEVTKTVKEKIEKVMK